MAKILSRYTKSKTLTQDIEFSSQKEYAKSLALGSKIKEPGDLNQPYTFRQWYDIQTGLIPGEEYIKYNEYLSNWYTNRENDSIATNIPTQQVYLDLINKLDIEFDDLHIKDKTDFKEILANIPEYAKKIKNISQYIIFKRESAKNAKLKYNMTGTGLSIERILYEYILKTFTKNKDANEYTVLAEQNLLSELPDLSATQNLQITIEPLYDDTPYFDKDPGVDINKYFQYTSTVAEYLSGFGIKNQNEFEWLYSTGVSQLCADNPLLWVVDDVLNQHENQTIPLSAIDDSINRTLNDYNRILLSEKYLGEDQYIVQHDPIIVTTTEEP